VGALKDMSSSCRTDILSLKRKKEKGSHSRPECILAAIKTVREKHRNTRNRCSLCMTDRNRKNQKLTLFCYSKRQ